MRIYVYIRICINAAVIALNYRGNLVHRSSEMSDVDGYRWLVPRVCAGSSLATLSAYCACIPFKRNNFQVLVCLW